MKPIIESLCRLCLMCEAAFFLLVILAMKIAGRSWIVRRALTPHESGPSVPLHLGKSVSRAVQRTCARLPVHCSSLDRALAGWLMIRRRGYYGSIDMRILDTRPGEFKAYANLISGEAIVIGRREPGKFRYERL